MTDLVGSYPSNVSDRETGVDPDIAVFARPAPCTFGPTGNGPAPETLEVIGAVLGLVSTVCGSLARKPTDAWRLGPEMIGGHVDDLLGCLSLFCRHKVRSQLVVLN